MVTGETDSAGVLIKANAKNLIASGIIAAQF